MDPMTYSYADPLPDPEHHPDYYASVPAKRLVAWLVDAVVVFVLACVVVLLTAFIGAFFFGFLLLAVGFLYRWITIAGTGATLGMRLMAIELRGPDGQLLDGGQAFGHTLGYTVSVAFPLIQLVSIGLMATSARGQGVTDFVMGTVALNRRSD